MRGPKAVADYHAVDVARVERARRALDAQRAHYADLLAERDGEQWVGTAAAGEQHGRLFNRIGFRQFGRHLAAGGERAGPAQDRAVQRADAQRRSEAGGDALSRRARGDGERLWHGDGAVLAQASEHRHVGAVAALEPVGERLR